jgi:hypothetical protein
MTTKKRSDVLSNGNPANRRGRPKGTLSINSQESIRKLQELGFDPLEKLVSQYQSVDLQLADMEAGRIKQSAMLKAQLEAIKKGIADTLMKYSYKPVPVSSEQTIENKTPLKITLTGVDD